jgi:hypothetical protein
MKTFNMFRKKEKEFRNMFNLPHILLKLHPKTTYYRVLKFCFSIKVAQGVHCKKRKSISNKIMDILKRFSKLLHSIRANSHKTCQRLCQKRIKILDKTKNNLMNNFLSKSKHRSLKMKDK